MASPRFRCVLPVILFLIACHAEPRPEIERRVPVDVVGDCVALRLGITECREEFTELVLERRGHAGQKPASRAQVLTELAREAGLPEVERRHQCRMATAETPPPAPEDVARLHRCLPLSCTQRLLCLRPLLAGR